MSKYKVCPSCEGEGYVSNIGAFTSADVDEWYGDDHDARDTFVSEYTRPGGAYDKHCPLCRGQRVATQQQIDDWTELRQLDAERAAELRAGC